MALPDKPRGEQVAYLLDTVDLGFGSLLWAPDPRRTSGEPAAITVSTTRRARGPRLADTLLSAFDGDPGDHGVTGLFAASRIDREAPKEAMISLLRHRQWLVEEVAPPPPNQLTLVKAVCLDDDNQGEPIEVLWEMELGAQVVEQEMGALGRASTSPASSPLIFTPSSGTR